MMRFTLLIFVISFIASVAQAQMAASSSGVPVFAPPTVEQAQMAASYGRMLMNLSSWGIISTIASDFNYTPFGNLASFADGGLGKPYFYLTTVDATAKYSLADQRASFSVNQIALGSCGEFDAQEPPCGKVTLIGNLKQLKGNSTDKEYGRKVLFEKHNRFNNIPSFLKSDIYKLDIEAVYVINTYGRPKYLTPKQYLSAKF